MNHSAAELSTIVQRVVNRYVRRVWWARKPDVKADLVGRAWVTILEVIAKDTYDPQVGIPEEKYLERAVALQLKRELYLISSPVSCASNDELSNLAETQRASGEEASANVNNVYSARFKRTHRSHVDVEELTNYAPPLAQISHREWAEQGNWADKLLADKSWKTRAREAISEVVTKKATDIVAMGVDAIFSGVEPKQYAEEHEIEDVHEVYRAIWRAKKALREHRVFYDLAKEIDK